MEKLIQKRNGLSIDTICSLIVTISLSLYIYCAHFKYSFMSTDFLYLALVMAVVTLVFQRYLVTTKPLIIYILIVLYTSIGYLYSSNPEEGLRQTIFFLIYIAFYWLAMQKSSFSNRIIKIMYVFSLIGMISVFIQFLIPDLFNTMLIKLLRTDRYDAVMWSFNVDGTYTGLTASVSMASFSMAVVFFTSVQKIININDSKTDIFQKRSVVFKVIYCFVAILALFGIILTSKRGIFIATIISFVMSLILDKDINLKKIKKTQVIFFGVGIIILIFTVVYLTESNEYVIKFISRFSGNNVTSGRNVFYENALNVFSQGNVRKLFFGYGTGAAFLINNTGLHNVYLQILFDHGLLGVALYGCFFIVNLRRAIKNKYFFSMCLQIVFLVYCMSGNPLYDYYFFIPYLIYSCYEG